jgi:hypothetical protein
MISAMRSPWRNKKGHAMGVTSDLDARGPAGAGPPALLGAEVNLLGLPWRVKEKGRAGLIFCLLLLAGSACAGLTKRPETVAGVGAISQELGRLRVSVEAQAWQGRPRKLTNYVLPFLVRIINNSENPVTIARSDFLLMDGTNRQYLPLPPAEVVTLLGGRAPSGVAVSPSVGVSGSTAGGTIFGAGLGIALGGYGSDNRDVIPDALADGPIQPGAEARGFLYFPPSASSFKSLRLVVMLRHIPGQPRLDFEFRRTGP